MKKHYYEKLLHIKTDGYQQEYDTLSHNHPYEPTDYAVLELLLDEFELNQTDSIIDFGAGLGRLCFFLHYFKHVMVKGVEMDETLYQQSIKNKQKYLRKTKKERDTIQFHHTLAEDYVIKRTDNRFYFFNPFSVQIFMKIIGNILRSVEESPRKVELILYYASEDYTYYLNNNTPFQIKQEIIVPHLYEKNPYEKLLIYHSSDLNISNG
jgi:16S rRNA A1518/A1519 N6-dimethyltransferase RsmA/KsgA/DIM1 with predicted DNA glycosylase/AP lyase activity